MTTDNSIDDATEDATDDERFVIRDREMIASILRALAHSASTVAVSFNTGEDILLTLVLDVEPATGSVLLDVNANQAMNQRLLATSRMVYTVLQDGVTVRWSGSLIQSASFGGRPAFRIPLPESLRRIQRRAFFRIAIPRSQRAVCSVAMDDGSRLELPLVDISAEGLGVVLPLPPDPAVSKGVLLADCQLSLPGEVPVRLAMLVQNVWQVDLKNGRHALHAGMHFLSPTPRTQQAIQRYVTRLDRERIAKLARR